MLWLALCLLHSASVAAFYIPGWSIKTYENGQKIPLFVNKIFSDRSEITYAYAELPFVCPPSGRNHGQGLIGGAHVTLNLGEVLRGDRIVVSDYDLEMGKDEESRYLCSRKIDSIALQRAQHVIQQGYVAEWIVDNLPGATRFVSVDRSRKYYAAGFRLGYEEKAPESRFFINNHVTLVIRYRRRSSQSTKKVIVGFEVYPKSIEATNRDIDGIPLQLDQVTRGMQLVLSSNDSSSSNTHDEMLNIPYTYSVYYREDEATAWSNRWDPYFVNQEDSHRIHWLGIVNSLVISGFMAIVVAVIFTRTIHGDIKGYRDTAAPDVKTRRSKIRNKLSAAPPRTSLEKSTGLLDQPDAEAEDNEQLSDDDQPLEEYTGWKQVHADVFRPPPYGTVLAPLIGSGLQLLLASLGLLCLSAVGVLNPSFRGGFMSVGIMLFVLAGAFSGYCSARVYKTFGGQDWKRNCVITAALFPGLMFATIFVLNLFVWAQSSSTALPFGSVVALVCLWLLVQVPLVCAGSLYGYVKVGAWQEPIKASAIPRQIPPQAWFARSTQATLLAGLIPFVVIFIELLFFFKSLWQDKSGYYYMFGFLTVVGAMWIAVIMEVTVVAVYFQLCAENYHWWWQSFFVGGSSAIWIFVYSAYYFLRHLHIQGIVSTLLFFSYSLLACSVYGLLAGTIGFLTAHAFVRRIYGAIKTD